MSFYKKLFKKIKYHIAGGKHGEIMNRRVSVESKQAWQKYRGTRGSARLGKDVASTIYKKLTGKNKF